MTPEQLLANFARLRALRVPRTFLELSGYPHYEKVCSNLLAFYLEPGAEHGLRDLLLRALMNCVGLRWETMIHRAKVITEVETDTGGRLDLLVTTDEFVIGIENKIWAALHNDLADYGTLVHARATEAGVPLKNTRLLVSSVRDLSADESRKARDAGFQAVRFSKLVSEVRQLLGHYTIRADLKQLGYLSDFMQTLENLSGIPNTELTRFFAPAWAGGGRPPPGIPRVSVSPYSRIAALPGGHRVG